MAAPLRMEKRLSSREAPMTAPEHLPARIDRLENRIDRLASDLRGEIRTGDEDTRRVLREEIRTGNVMIVTSLTDGSKNRGVSRAFYSTTLSGASVSSPKELRHSARPPRRCPPVSASHGPRPERCSIRPFHA